MGIPQGHPHLPYSVLSRTAEALVDQWFKELNEKGGAEAKAKLKGTSGSGMEAARPQTYGWLSIIPWDVCLTWLYHHGLFSKLTN